MGSRHSLVAPKFDPHSLPVVSQPIGLVRDYDDIVAIARARRAQLDISYETLDDVAGVQSGYSAKVLGPTPSRRLDTK